jgi:CspA family cold shock protein
MSSRTKLIAGTVAVAALAAAGAAFAAVELSSSSSSVSEPAVTSPFGQGISGSGLGGGRLGGRGLGGGLGSGEGGFRGGFGGRGFGGGDTAAATYLGLSAAALQTQLAGGKTMAQVATAQGKSVAGLVAVMLVAQKKRLASAVASGFLTDDQAQQIESSMADRIKDLVNGVRPRFGGGPDDAGGLGEGGPNDGGLRGGTGNSAGSGSFGATA